MKVDFLPGLDKLMGPVLVTGHTGFKGVWLTLLLEARGIPVVGLSLLPTETSLFSRLERTGAIPETFVDINDYDRTQNFIEKVKPSAVIHMAAQPLVMQSYENPLNTYKVNVIGTANLLDIAVKTEFVDNVIVVTTDKVYKNQNSGMGFVESDPLEGKDPYSASKVGTESAVQAWRQVAKFKNRSLNILSVRAGNVIGGGDFAKDRLLPDIIRARTNKTKLVIRNSASTRPWQHVLDPLCGYLMALEASLNGDNSEEYNFGPSEKSLSVADVIEIGQNYWGKNFPEYENLHNTADDIYESKYLDLVSKRAFTELKWQPKLNQKEAIISTLNWWDTVLDSKGSAADACARDINYFTTTLNFDL